MTQHYANEVRTVLEQYPRVAIGVLIFAVVYFLYGVLGKRYLGADDDFWEVIRGRLIPLFDQVAQRFGGYVYTTTSKHEYAGWVRMTEEKFEEKLEEAGYLRQPVASLHRNPSGWIEDGSWSKTFGPLFPIEVVVSWFTTGRIRIPFLAEYTRRFLKSINSILALYQYHQVYYVENTQDGPKIHDYCHREWNPLNPFVAWWHYQGEGFTASPEVARRHLKQVGVTLKGGE